MNSDLLLEMGGCYVHTFFCRISFSRSLTSARSLSRALSHFQTVPMEYRVHKCRFSDWKPSVIRSIASDPFSRLVAVGREDGDVEVRS